MVWPAMAATYQPLQTIRDSYINCRSLNAKRKSAVELLQETKSLYVKSETVLDNEQRLVKSAKCDTQCTPKITPKEEIRRRTSCPQRRSAKSCSEQFQVKLRRLLNGNSKENLADGQNWDVLDSKSCKNEFLPMENFKADFFTTDIQYQSLPDLSVSSKESISYMQNHPLRDLNSNDDEEPASDSDSSEKKMTISGADSLEEVNTDSSEKSYGKPPSMIKSVSSMGGSAGKVEERLSSWTLEHHKELPRSKSYVAEYQALSAAVQEQLPHDLDVFFQNLGLSSEQYSAITCNNQSQTSSPVFFSCGNSTDDESYCSKAPKRWGGSGDTNTEDTPNNATLDEQRRDNNTGSSVSIVEANARIVKWLCQLSSGTNTANGPEAKKIIS